MSMPMLNKMSMSVSMSKDKAANDVLMRANILTQQQREKKCLGSDSRLGSGLGSSSQKPTFIPYYSPDNKPVSCPDVFSRSVFYDV